MRPAYPTHRRRPACAEVPNVVTVTNAAVRCSRRLRVLAVVGVLVEAGQHVGCIACTSRARTPPTRVAASACTAQIVEPGPNQPSSPGSAMARTHGAPPSAYPVSRVRTAARGDGRATGRPPSGPYDEWCQHHDDWRVSTVVVSTLPHDARSRRSRDGPAADRGAEMATALLTATDGAARRDLGDRPGPGRGGVLRPGRASWRPTISARFASVSGEVTVGAGARRPGRGGRHLDDHRQPARTTR